MAQVAVTRRVEWDAMHRIPRHESKCRAYHGHRYVAEISCFAEDLDEIGRIVDFGVIKERVGSWVNDNWDHTAILMRGDDDPAIRLLAASNKAFGRPVYWLDESPTAENIVVELAKIASELLADTGVQISRIRLWETPNCSVEWRVDATT